MAAVIVDGAGHAVRARVSVVIPTYQELASVRRALHSLFEQDLDKDQYEVIVVDSSPDEHVVRLIQELQARAPCRVRLFVKHAEGAGPSRNLGAQAATGDVIAFMDSDCQATPQWLRAGLAAFAAGVGIVQGRTLPEPGVRLGVFQHYVRVEEPSFRYECANVFYRKCAFEQAGGFSHVYNSRGLHGLGGEDLDLAWRVKRNGWETRFCHAALVYHEVQPLSPIRWIVIKTLYTWPLLAKRFPELRPFFFARYFFDRHQACLIPALIGLGLSWFTPLALALCVPYALSRGTEPSRTLGGLGRPLRVLAYALRDVVSLAILTTGSVRFRALLL